jgi:F0F1-type ATP synthase assembly protein I
VKNRQHAKESQAGKNRQQGAVYQGAFEAVIALLIAAGFGYWLDGYFDTTPWLLLIGTAIGFASFTVRLIRLGRWMRDESPDEARQDDESE